MKKFICATLFFGNLFMSSLFALTIKPAGALEGHSRKVTGVQFFKENNTLKLASISLDYYLKIWNLPGKNNVSYMFENKVDLDYVNILQCGELNYLACTQYNGHVSLFNTQLHLAGSFDTELRGLKHVSSFSCNNTAALLFGAGCNFSLWEKQPDEFSFILSKKQAGNEYIYDLNIVISQDRPCLIGHKNHDIFVLNAYDHKNIMLQVHMQDYYRQENMTCRTIEFLKAITTSEGNIIVTALTRVHPKNAQIIETGEGWVSIADGYYHLINFLIEADLSRISQLSGIKLAKCQTLMKILEINKKIYAVLSLDERGVIIKSIQDTHLFKEIITNSRVTSIDAAAIDEQTSLLALGTYSGPIGLWELNNDE